MSSIFINGAKYAVSTTLGAPITVSGISNADPAEAASATPPADGSIIVIKSGWPELNETIARVDGSESNKFDLEGVDTTNLTRFPTGEGAGTVQVAGGFTSLSQVRDVTMSGGEQQFFQWQYVEDRSSRQRQKPTFKNAMNLAIVLDYDNSLTWYDKLIEIDAARDPVVVRETLPNGVIIYYYAYPSFNKVPTKTINENLTVTANFSLISDPMRYEAA